MNTIDRHPFKKIFTELKDSDKNKAPISHTGSKKRHKFKLILPSIEVNGRKFKDRYKGEENNSGKGYNSKNKRHLHRFYVQEPNAGGAECCYISSSVLDYTPMSYYTSSGGNSNNNNAVFGYVKDSGKQSRLKLGQERSINRSSNSEIDYEGSGVDGGSGDLVKNSHMHSHSQVTTARDSHILEVQSSVNNNSTPYRFRFRKTENSTDEQTSTQPLSNGYTHVLVTDNEREMLTRERSFLGTPGNFNILPDKQNLSELQIIVGDRDNVNNNNAEKDGVGSGNKRRLLRKPLPFNHYKKTQKVNTFQPSDFMYTNYSKDGSEAKLNMLTSQSADYKCDGRENSDIHQELNVNKESKKIVANWLQQIDHRMQNDLSSTIRTKPESTTASIMEYEDINIEKGDLFNELERYHPKQSGKCRLKHTRKTILPDIVSASPDSRKSAKVALQLSNRPDALSENDELTSGHHKQEGADKGHTDVVVTLPGISANNINNSSSKAVNEKESNTGDFNTDRLPNMYDVGDSASLRNEDQDDPVVDHLYQDYFDDDDEENDDGALNEDGEPYFPQLLDGMDQDKDDLARERLHLLNLERFANGMNFYMPPTSRSEPAFNNAVVRFLSQGTSSRATIKKQSSLRDMAASFKSRMGYPIASPTKCGDRVWRDRITKHSNSVIENENYDMFARNRFTKAKINYGGSSGNEGLKEGSHELVLPPRRSLTFPKESSLTLQQQHQSNIAALQQQKTSEINTLAKMKYSFKRENSNVSLQSSSGSLKRENNIARKSRRFSGSGDESSTMTKAYKAYRSDSNITVTSVKIGPKKASNNPNKLRRSKTKIVYASNEE